MPLATVLSILESGASLTTVCIAPRLVLLVARLPVLGVSAPSTVVCTLQGLVPAAVVGGYLWTGASLLVFLPFPC